MKEIERRFLVTDPTIVDGHTSCFISQGYLWQRDGWAVRTRRIFYLDADSAEVIEAPSKFAIKGPRSFAERLEYEWEIPLPTAKSLMRLSPCKVFKSRYSIVEGDELWDVDVFHLNNDGLIIAECEMDSHRPIGIPEWCDQEVTDDARYNNESLACEPFTTW